jgi:enoyl-CoA hydratase/carnithine racemase
MGQFEDTWRMIDVKRENGVWTVTLSRPEKANSLTKTMLSDLTSIVAEAAASQVRVLVLTGAGKVFSAGADLDEARAGLARDDIWEEVSGAIAALPCLTIAALNGTLAGGAFGMALACDLRVAVAKAKFFYPVMKLGFLPQPSDPARLMALVGPSRAKMILMAGARIEAEEALAWGLIDRIAPPDGLIEATNGLAADALGAEALHVAAIKEMLRSERTSTRPIGEQLG